MIFFSINSQIICPIKICISWIRSTLNDGTFISILLNLFFDLFLIEFKKITLIFFSLAFLIAFRIFLLLPLVEIAIRTSFFFPIASICLEKILSNPKSFAIAVIVDKFEDKETEA